MHPLPLRFIAALLALASSALAAAPAALPPNVQARIDAQLAIAAEWAAHPAVVEAVRAHNTGLTPEEDALTQEKWHSLPSLDALVRSYTKSPLGAFLREKQSPLIGEAFVCDAAGYKVGFINKPSRWCHAGTPKHDVPMTGKRWQGPTALDESTGLRLIQIALPVLDDGKPIGSLVVGLSRAALAD